MRLALTDLRRGVVVLPSDPTLSPIRVSAQPPGSNPAAPYAVARLADGRLVVADRRGHRIVAMSEDGADWASFGGPGSGAGQLQAPAGVAVGPDGRIYVADTGNSRIVVVDSMAGDGWISYGTHGGPAPGDPGIGRFASPVAIAVGTAGVVVADPGAARVVQLSSLDDAGWDATPPGAVRGPSALALLPGGQIVVADLIARRLTFLQTPSAGVIDSLTGPLLAGPSSVVAIDDDQLIVCVAPLTALFSVTRSDGAWTVALDRQLDRVGLHRPTALCLLP